MNPADAPELNEMAHWLSVLGLTGLKPPVRDAALAHVAQIHMAQAIELTTALTELAKARVALARFQMLENSVASVLAEFRAPVAAPVAPRLQLVRESGGAPKMSCFCDGSGCVGCAR